MPIQISQQTVVRKNQGVKEETSGSKTEVEEEKQGLQAGRWTFDHPASV